MRQQMIRTQLHTSISFERSNSIMNVLESCVKFGHDYLAMVLSVLAKDFYPTWERLIYKYDTSKFIKAVQGKQVILEPSAAIFSAGNNPVLIG